jgi:hypothetical protein
VDWKDDLIGRCTSEEVSKYENTRDNDNGITLTIFNEKENFAEEGELLVSIRVESAGN